MRAKFPAFLLALTLLATAGAVTAPAASAATGPAATVFSLTNAQRATAGLKPLISDPALDKAALKLSVFWRDAAQGYLDVYQRAGKRLKLKAPA